MGFMRFFKGLTRMRPVSGTHTQPQHLRKTLVLYTHVTTGLGLTDTVYCESRKFEIYAAAPDLWNIDIVSYEIDREHQYDGNPAHVTRDTPRRWYPDGYLARAVSADDTLALLRPYLNTHNYASLQEFLQTDTWILLQTGRAEQSAGYAR